MENGTRNAQLNRFMNPGRAFQFFQVVRQGASILIAILLAKSVLSSAEIGNYEQLWYVGNTLSFFWVAGLIQGILTFFPGLKEKEEKGFFFEAYLTFLMISAGICLLLLVFEGPLVRFFTGQEQLDYYRLFIVFVFFNWPTYLLENFYLLHKKSWPIIYFALLAFVGQIVAVILPLYLGYDFVYSFYALIVLALVKHAWLLGYLFRVSHFHWNPVVIREWFFLALPLIAYALLGGFNTAFDNWIVNYFYDGDQEKFAVFRYGARELPLALAMASAFSTAMLPEVAADTEQSLQVIKRRSKTLFHLLFPISIVLLLTSQWFFPWVFSPEFEGSIVVFNTYLLIIISRLIFSRTILVGLKDNNMVLVISVVELIINIGLSVLFIQEWGLAGIAMATVIAYMAEKLLISAYLYRKYQIGLAAYTDLRWYGVYSLLLVLAFVWVEVIN
jgi:O-antigen/teichoic acid export membrane protein